MAVSFLFCFLLLFVCRSSVTAEEEQMFDGNQTLETMVRMETKMAELEGNVSSILEHYREEMDELRTQNGKMKRKNKLFKKKVLSILKDRGVEMDGEFQKQNDTLETLIADYYDVPDDERNTTEAMENVAIHGGWSDWENWGTCSATCGIGMHSRLRSCTDPAPDRFGDQCLGHSIEYKLCDQSKCEESIKDTPKVAFNAYTTSLGNYPENKVLVFPNVLLDEGGGYNKTTGKFTAPISGLYHFQAHVCNHNEKAIVVSIIHGSKRLATTTEYESGSSSCSSVSAPALVKVGENVFIESSYSKSWLRSDSHRWPSFSGFLVMKG